MGLVNFMIPGAIIGLLIIPIYRANVRRVQVFRPVYLGCVIDGQTVKRFSSSHTLLNSNVKYTQVVIPVPDLCWIDSF